MTDGLKVFISWSKDRSKRVAIVLQEYLPQFIDGVDYFVSDKDIDPGERSMKTVEAELDGTNYGLLVVTPENQGEAWLNFEAGALSKHVDKDKNDVPRVVPILVGIDSPSQLTGPISQFQAVKLNHEGIERVVLSIARLSGTSEGVVQKRFARTWDELEIALSAATAASPAPPLKPKRSDENKLDEVLEIVRELVRRSPPQTLNFADGSSTTVVELKSNSRRTSLKSLEAAGRDLADHHGLEFKGVDLRLGGAMIEVSGSMEDESSGKVRRYIDDIRRLTGESISVSFTPR